MRISDWSSDVCSSDLLSELDPLVESDLRLSRLWLEGRVPGASLGTVEAAAERMSMTEGGIDDPVVRHTKHQLVDADAGQEIILGQQPVVGRVVEVEDVLEGSVVLGDLRKHAIHNLDVC